MRRKAVQTVSALAANANLKGLREGKLYSGSSKNLCVPGLNCYSCPAASGSCPVGSFQAVVGGMKYGFSYYIFGFLLLLGVVFGRFICGWLCPFGLLQDVLNRIPSPKIALKGQWRNLRYLKYAVLAVFVVALPVVMQDELGISSPYFCKYICPAGTLEAGIPLMIASESVRGAAGWLFVWKLSILVLMISASVVLFRPFCRFACPLGAFYSMFNKVSLCRMNVDENACIHCGKCEEACGMDIKVYAQPNSPECIRCGDCVRSCPTGAISRENMRLANIKKH